MNPPINRENLRDALIALVLATGLAWIVSALDGHAANSAPPRKNVAAPFISLQGQPR